MSLLSGIIVREEFTKVFDLLTKRLEKALTEEGNAIVVAAQANLYPGHGYETGELHDSIHYDTIDSLHGELHVDAPYAAYVEFGTYKMDARTYLTPAIEHEWPGALLKSMKGSETSETILPSA